jgi:hypothetical protein
MELKNKCDAVEKRESEKRQLEEKKHQEELQALKKTNQQLKVRTDWHSCTICISVCAIIGSTGRNNSTSKEIN